MSEAEKGFREGDTVYLDARLLGLLPLDAPAGTIRAFTITDVQPNSITIGAQPIPLANPDE